MQLERLDLRFRLRGQSAPSAGPPALACFRGEEKEPLEELCAALGRLQRLTWLFFGVAQQACEGLAPAPRDEEDDFLDYCEYFREPPSIAVWERTGAELGRSVGRLAALEHLEVELHLCGLAGVDELGEGVGQLRKLAHLRLVFCACDHLRDVSALWRGLRLLRPLVGPVRLHALDVRLEACAALPSRLLQAFTTVQALGAAIEPPEVPLTRRSKERAEDARPSLEPAPPRSWGSLMAQQASRRAADAHHVEPAAEAAAEHFFVPLPASPARSPRVTPRGPSPAPAEPAEPDPSEVPAEPVFILRKVCVRR